MKSEKYIEWRDDFRQGDTVRIPRPVEYAYIAFQNTYLWTDCDYVVLSERFTIAPKFIDKGIHKANRLWKYYTFKQLPGAVIFLGAL